jgi:hypothetical protein
MVAVRTKATLSLDGGLLMEDAPEINVTVNLTHM